MDDGFFCGNTSDFSGKTACECDIIVVRTERDDYIAAFFSVFFSDSAADLFVCQIRYGFEGEGDMLSSSTKSKYLAIVVKLDFVG